MLYREERKIKKPNKVSNKKKIVHNKKHRKDVSTITYQILEILLQA